ncbi:GNAT family N-acetyltransferase [Cellulomonas carbonis]|uniref:GCN5 family acetyltransferase n=1 Tax=Cellulomonas carbonis T26 TaxID=947969 RepID=A0A0A0BUW6_9CELL|nr:GNAT family N-acetyltransferase [Cellulomonas carbonis]KGM11730.1 GCN5 family acetyltransferase [Cellulomonas carbonis T26]
MRVARIDEDEWERLRDARLRAVTGEPEIYGWALARETTFREQHWRMRLRGAPWWVAEEAGEDVGLVQLVVEPGAPADERHVLALWVDPSHRRSGHGAALVRAAVDAAGADGAARVTAWVPEGDGAEGLAAAVGFVRTGERVPAPRRPGVAEVRWVRPVVVPPPS